LSPEKVIRNLSSSLPRLGLSALILCLASGFVLSFYYRPMGNVFQNVEEITTLVPYGAFFRQVHYGAGQLFVILMLLHTVDHFLKRRYGTYSQRTWNLLVVSLCLCFLTLFTGFVLKGDKEGLFAGRIFMNLLRGIPLVGDRLSRLFIVPGEGFFFLPYLYHCLFLPLLIIYLIRGHIREWLPDQKFLLTAAVGLFSYGLIVAPALDIPPSAPAKEVSGPWFFLGIQTLLKFMPPLWAGVLLPALFLSWVLILPMIPKPGRDLIHYTLIGAFCLYGLLVVRVLFAGP
jgi:ubiquinol-cytochrome c reductase cytochrome b subunit